jgi:hypothetical protein
MSTRPDLTRWNRSGLSRFRYVGGNAVTHLEALRAALAKALDEGGTPRWRILGAPSAETPREAFERLLAQYHWPRQEHAWEILRTFARATHVLTEHLDAFANESFLGTASQWDNVRRLVEMIDYHPAPPASASTHLALHAKEGAADTLAAGFAVKHQPADGTPPIVFETLEDLPFDARLNALRLTGWNVSRANLPVHSTATGATVTFAPAEATDGLSAGHRGLLVVREGDVSEEAIPCEVSALSEASLTLALARAPDGTVHLGAARLLLDPAFVAPPRLLGENSLELDREASIAAGDRVAWAQGGVWEIAEVVARDGRRLRLDLHGASLPTSGTTLYHTARTRRHGGSILVPAERGAGKTVWNSAFQRFSSTELQKVEVTGDSGPVHLNDRITGASHQSAWYVYADEASLGTVARSAPASFDFPGDPGGLASGQWVLVTGGGTPSAARVDRLTKGANGFALAFANGFAFPPDGVLHGAFTREIRPAGHDLNPLPAAEPAGSSDSQSTLHLALVDPPEMLARGRRLIVRDAESAELVTVRAVEATPEGVTVVVTPGLRSAYPKSGTTVHGNVVPAGHGESQPASVLGSGDAARAGQEMIFATPGVAFVPDSGMPSGVAAAVEVTVAGQTWKEVPNLAEAAPEVPAYTVRLTEDGHLRLTFGDGFHGRRLPTGHNNVKLTARLGHGLAGNLPPGSLRKPVKPHSRLVRIEQPLPSTGGNDLEDVTSLREQAPATLFALERAVSLEDFTALAASHSAVWQAKAIVEPAPFSAQEAVAVAVVPSGGGLLGPLAAELEAFLAAHSLPGVRISVRDFRPVLLSLVVEVGVKFSEYDEATVLTAVRTALLDAFSLRHRRLGAPLFRSEVIAVVEAVAGVENGTCQLSVDATSLGDVRFGTGPDGYLRSVRVAPDQVLHLDPALSILDLTARAFAL